MLLLLLPEIKTEIKTRIKAKIKARERKIKEQDGHPFSLHGLNLKNEVNHQHQPVGAGSNWT
ncbi:hypothetical protein KSF_064240 [Reticulibacter mediterranei]|uniref:Uncharacterized protein n=1 Tax=Reticulibacter mediterranei TaxID=2778369 RepID=A0A8J3IUD2_9CHLR|nr:hypothetical protein KSF_064240 [Reticulibacter mediterranei]